MRYMRTLERSLVRTRLYNVLKANFYDSYKKEYKDVIIEDITDVKLLGLHGFGKTLLLAFKEVRDDYLKIIDQTRGCRNF